MEQHYPSLDVPDLPSSGSSGRNNRGEVSGRKLINLLFQPRQPVLSSLDLIPSPCPPQRHLSHRPLRSPPAVPPPLFPPHLPCPTAPSLLNPDQARLNLRANEPDVSCPAYARDGQPDVRLRAASIQVAQEINSEAKFQNEFLNQLQLTLTKAQAGVKNNMRRMNKSIIQQGSNHIVHVVLFALLCFFVVYLLSKFSRR
ncbi:hypothetical protein D1007_36581 [Hordeum vulgare]|nr:hypothetical protein D1007_36581 [Hordeum vulgare]